MAIGLELTDDEMARVMECRERWSDDEIIERAAGICVSEMVRTFELLAARAERDIVRKKRIDQGRQYRGDRRANEKR
jgi:CRP-like cAMP-binding protein